MSRAARPYVFLAAALLAGDLAKDLVRGTTLWRDWEASAADHESLFADPFLEVLPSAAVALTLIGSRLTRAELSLGIGDLGRALSLGPLHARWWLLAPLMTLFVAAPLLAQLAITIRPDPSRLQYGAALLPAAFAFAAINAALEEFRFRAAPLARLIPVVGVGQALLLTSARFGIGHFFGHPAGVSGVILAALAGWLLGVAMRGTRGFLAPWLIHGAQDVLIFEDVALAESRGG